MTIIRREGGGLMLDYDFFVGVDWATQAHEICVLNDAGVIVDAGSVAHSGAGMAELRTRLSRLTADPSRIAVAIETPRAAVVDTLLAHGSHVFAVNPKQLDRFRDRHTVAGAKDDRRDAFVAADAVRTDRWAFRRLQPEDPRLLELREISRAYEELVTEQVRLAHRLREQLQRFYPQVLTLCPAADEPWVWTLVDRLPTPAAAAGRARGRVVRALLAQHRIRRITAEEVHHVLTAAALPVAPGVTEAATAHIALLVPRLRLVHEQRTHCERRLDVLLTALATPAADSEQPEHRDVTILRSLPGVGRVVAATMLAEATRPLAARDYQTLRAHAGVAPVTRQSGKTRLVAMRHSCNSRLRTAVFHWASNSIRLDDRCRQHYDHLRQRHNHARALRGVADRLLRILIVMLTEGAVYDPGRPRMRAA